MYLEYDGPPNSTRCTLRLDDLVPHLNTYIEVSSLQIIYYPTELDGTLYHPMTLEFEESPILLQSPVRLKDLSFLFVECSWDQLTVFMQHFYFFENVYPSPSTDEQVYDDIKDAKLNTTSRPDWGLQFYVWFPVDTQIEDTHILQEYDSQSGLKPLVGMENINSLVLHLFTKVPYLTTIIDFSIFPETIKIPAVLKDYLWPELEYLELSVTDFNITDILELENAAPKLKYLKLYFSHGIIPEAVWTIDWRMLPWRTGIIFWGKSGHVSVLDLTDRKTMDSVPPVHFLFLHSKIPDHFTRRRKLIVDFSNNHLTSLKYFHFSCDVDYDIHLNFSHNNLIYISILEKFATQNIFTGGSLESP